MNLDMFAAEITSARRRADQLKRRYGDARGDPAAEEALAELLTVLEELRVAEEELRAQIDELAEAQLATEHERRRYQQLFDLAPDGYLVTDPEGLVLEANLTAGNLLESEARFLIGKPLAALVPEN